MSESGATELFVSNVAILLCANVTVRQGILGRFERR